MRDTDYRVYLEAIQNYLLFPPVVASRLIEQIANLSDQVVLTLLIKTLYEDRELVSNSNAELTNGNLLAIVGGHYSFPRAVETTALEEGLPEGFNPLDPSNALLNRHYQHESEVLVYLAHIVALVQVLSTNPAAIGMLSGNAVRKEKDGTPAIWSEAQTYYVLLRDVVLPALSDNVEWQEGILARVYSEPHAHSTLENIQFSVGEYVRQLGTLAGDATVAIITWGFKEEAVKVYFKIAKKEQMLPQAVTTSILPVGNLANEQERRVVEEANVRKARELQQLTQQQRDERNRDRENSANHAHALAFA